MEGELELKVKNLVKRYDGKNVLDGVNFSFEDGRVYAVMGPSGGGKTTLLHVLMGVLKEEEGEVEGRETKKFSAVFQENRLFEFLTAAENVVVVGEKGETQEELAKVARILQEILPEEALGQCVAEYSGGMKRRVAIARAVLAKSDVIVMDEPFTGLDEETKGKVVAFIEKYREGRTLIFSTHQEEEVELLGAEKVWV